MSVTFEPTSAPRNAVSCVDSSALSADGVSVPLRVYEPAAPITATLVWAHGGSWTRGSIREWHLPCLALAQLGTARIISVGYRLAPEWEHPTAMLDVEAATRWAQQTFDGPVFLGGDSAGGTLAASAALRLRDTGTPPDGQLLAYPPLDPECSAPSYRQPGQPFPPRRMLLTAWKDYAGETRDARGWDYLSALHAPHLGGLCPTAILVGPHDPVRDDVETFAARLAHDNVPVTVCRNTAVSHGDFLSGPGLQASPVHTWIHHSLAHLITMKESTHD